MNRLLRASAGVAATAVMAISGVVAAPSASAASTCRTIEGARLCVNVHWPVGSSKYYGRASIVDVDGGSNLSVAVTNIRLQHFNGSRWVTVRELYDYDGWFGRKDSGQTAAVNPCNYRNAVFRTVAYFQWRGGQSGAKTLASGSHGHNC